MKGKGKGAGSKWQGKTIRAENQFNSISAKEQLRQELLKHLEDDLHEPHLLQAPSTDSDQASSVNSALTNAVEALFGHAKARAIASDESMVHLTNRLGKRLLSRQPRATFLQADDHRPSAQYAWIKHRLVSPEEVRDTLNKYNVSETRIDSVLQILKDHNLIHVIVTNINDEEWVVRSYFWDAHIKDIRDIFQTSIFDLLEYDDPTIISDAVADPIFEAALKAYFESGDTTSRRNWHTLSKFKSPSNLLNYCCANNFPECVDLLLSSYSEDTARFPWLALAEPTFAADKFNNTAFHAAAYNGSAECLDILVKHAATFQIQLESFRDSKRQNCYELARQRGHHRCGDILAPFFGQTTLGTSLCDAIRADQETGLLILDFKTETEEDVSKEVGLIAASQLMSVFEMDGTTWRVINDTDVSTYADSVFLRFLKGSTLVRVETMLRELVWDATFSSLTLEERMFPYRDERLRVTRAQRTYHRFDSNEGNIAEVLYALKQKRLHLPENANLTSVMLKNFNFCESASRFRNDEVSFRNFFENLLCCKSISFHKCASSGTSLLHIIRAVRHLVCRPSCRWQRLYVIPGPGRDAPSTVFPEFHDELPLLVNQLRASRLLLLSKSGAKRSWLPDWPIPENDRVWGSIVETSLDLNSAVHKIKDRRDINKMQPHMTVPDLFLRGLQLIWQRYMNRTKTVFETKGSSLDEAFDIDSLKIYIPEWLRNVTNELKCDTRHDFDWWALQHDLSQQEFEELLSHLDFAIFTLLRMHRLLPRIPELVLQIVCSKLLARLQKTSQYLAEKEWLKEPKPDMMTS